MAMIVQTQKKAKNIEKRREKSRYAARHRREKEAAIYSGLYKIVPIVQEPTVTHMDRIAVLRLASCFCRSRFVAARVLSDLRPSKGLPVGSSDELEMELSQLIDGFLFMVDSNGLISYISQGVSASLGLTQTDLVGHNLFDYVHHDDHTQLQAQLEHKENETSTDLRESVLRVKSVLTARGRNLNLRSAIYKTISFSIARLPLGRDSTEQSFALDLCGLPVTAQTPHTPDSDDEFKDENDSDGETSGQDGIGSPPVKQPLPSAYYLLYGMPILCPSTSDKIGDATCFVTRHSMDMKISYCHERISDIMGYDVKSLVGTSFFNLVHADDLLRICEELKTLQQRNQSILGVYRLMSKGGSFVWMYSEASLVSHNTRGHKGQYVVCMHQLIGACDTSGHTKSASHSLKSHVDMMRDEEYRKYRMMKDQCGTGSPEMLSPASIPSLTSDQDSPYHLKKNFLDNGSLYTRNPNDCLCDINDQFDDLALLAPFVAPNEVLSLEIPLEPFDANCPEVVDFCNEMRADPEFALYLNNFVVDDDMTQEFAKAKEGFVHGNIMQKELAEYDAEWRKHLLHSQQERPEKKLFDHPPPVERLNFCNNGTGAFFPAKPPAVFQTFPSTPLLAANGQSCLTPGFLHSPPGSVPQTKLMCQEQPVRPKSDESPCMKATVNRYGGNSNNCPTPPYATVFKDGGGPAPGFSGPADRRKRKFSGPTEADMFGEGQIRGTLWRPQRLSTADGGMVEKSRKRSAYNGPVSG